MDEDQTGAHGAGDPRGREVTLFGALGQTLIAALVGVALSASSFCMPTVDRALVSLLFFAGPVGFAGASVGLVFRHRASSRAVVAALAVPLALGLPPVVGGLWWIRTNLYSGSCEWCALPVIAAGAAYAIYVALIAVVAAATRLLLVDRGEA